MSNTIQFDDKEVKEINNLSRNNQEDWQEDILEKINKQIEFLKNKFEVAKTVDNNQQEDNKSGQNKNQSQSNKINLQSENYNEITKTIKNEK
jgi:hypothetical protein